jgi:hypothetical protein
MRRIALALCISLFAASPAFAQSQTAPPLPTPPTPPAPPTVVVGPRGGQTSIPVAPVAERSTLPTASAFARIAPASWQNIKLDVVIADSLVPDLQSKKAVSMLILDGLSGQVRSSAGEGLINIDARPTIRPDGRIWVQVTIEYRPELSGQQLQQAGLNRTALFSESLALLVADGKPVLASQSADPRSDRKVSVEITASIIK